MRTLLLLLLATVFWGCDTHTSVVDAELAPPSPVASTPSTVTYRFSNPDGLNGVTYIDTPTIPTGETFWGSDDHPPTDYEVTVPYFRGLKMASTSLQFPDGAPSTIEIYEDGVLVATNVGGGAAVYGAEKYMLWYQVIGMDTATPAMWVNDTPLELERTIDGRVHYASESREYEPGTTIRVQSDGEVSVGFYLRFPSCLGQMITVGLINSTMTDRADLELRLG